ncbi:14361_t:CDS:2 [Dentiscutata heterogama]|uniref:14361_t:CDS:1 n=1 Tax=Dentiscutata heterogama TaxID=1316150 RepID=A0ACA9PIA8_9GLOM|nr:14361_t:CDS:2 [Dentiscutata heterogama]
MSSEKPILYSYYRSSCSWRVRTCLNWKGIDYEYCPVNLLKGAQNKEEYSEINPYELVPTLKINGIVLSQSVRSLVQAIAGDIQPLQNLRSVTFIESIGGNRDEWINYCIVQGFAGVEKQLAKTSGKYCVGDEVTLADVVLLPQVYNSNRFGIDMTKFPLIQRIANDLYELDAFKKAHPQNQIDCPAEEKN